MIEQFNEEANIFFTMDPDAKEGFIVEEMTALGPNLVMAILKKPEEQDK
ncbi:MAG: hypothetical protein ACTSUX_12415 [Promethearchaeota archaeon]